MDTSSTEEYEPSEDEEISSVQRSGSVVKILPEHYNSPSAGQGVTSTDTGATKLTRKTNGNASSSTKLPKVQPTPAYHALLDEIGRETTLEGKTDNNIHLRSSQVGLTFWSSNEKEVFFSALSRRGKNDLQGIARAIGSKSEPEIHLYLQLLHQEAAQLKKESQAQVINTADLPAAAEINKDTSSLLNNAAEGVRSEETEFDERTEREIFGDFWLLDYKFASIYDQKTVEDKSAMFLNDKPHLQRSMQLLDLYNFLEISLTFFMNSHRPRDNWRAYAENSETPSLYASAFVAFHDLVLDITKRLISSALFFAMSRLRNRTSMQYVEQHGLGGFVRKDDVLAAVNILGLKPNKQKFWLGVAQRCNLEVYEEVSRRGVGLHEPLSLDEVTKRLMESRSRTSSVALSPAEREKSLVKTKNPSTPNNDFQSDRDMSNLSDSLESTASEVHEKEQEFYAESLDFDASRQEEQRLMDVLKIRKRPSHRIGAEDNNRAKRPKTDTIKDNGPTDWTNWLEYQSPWERYKNPVPEADFVKNKMPNRPRRVPSSPVQKIKATSRKVRRSRKRNHPKSKEIILAEDEVDNSEEMADIPGEPVIDMEVNDEHSETKEEIQSSLNDTTNSDTESVSHDHEMRDADDEYEAHDIRMQGIRESRPGLAKPFISLRDIIEDKNATRDRGRRYDAFVGRRPDNEERGRTGYEEHHSLSNTEDEESGGESGDLLETGSTNEDEEEDV